MSTARHPRHDPDDLAVTHDELAPVCTDFDAAQETPEIARGSEPEVDAVLARPPTLDEVRAVMGASAASDAAGTEWAARLEARVAVLERGARRKSLLRTWAERVGSYLAGSVTVALVWVLAVARDSGDARGVAREREAERHYLVDMVRDLVRRDALQQGQIDALTDRLRYPMQGPPTEPRTP